MDADELAAGLLRKHAPSEDLYEIVLAHSRTVRDVACRIAADCPGVDRRLVERGALLHDIGRFVVPGGARTCRHGLEGAEILRAEGLFGEALIAERHVGAGIAREEIVGQDLPLPPRDFLPRSAEEKIVCHADNLVSGTRERSFDDYLRKLTAKHPERIVERAKALRDDVEGLRVPRGSAS
jgi:uncharacterized protein